MKKFYSLSILLLISIAVWSQKTWTGGSGNWNDGTKWTPNGVPAANSTVTFNVGAAATINNVPNITLNRITVMAGSEIILQPVGAANALLTLNNAAGTDFTIENNASLTLGQNVSLSLDNNVDGTIAGTFIVNGGTFSTGGGGSVTTVTGTLQNSGTVNITQNGGLAFGATGRYIHARNGGVIPQASWNNTSTCIISGVVDQMPTVTGFNQAFGNFEWNSVNQVPFVAPAIPTLGGQLTNIDGNLTIKSTGTGALYFATSGTPFAVIEGDYIQTGGTFVVNQATAASPSGGTGNINILGNFNMSGGTLSRSTTPSGTSTISFTGDNAHSFTKTGGNITGPVDFEVGDNESLDFGTSILNGSTGAFRLLGGAKIITSNPAGLNSAGATGSIQTTTRSFSADADYEFRGANTGIFNTGGSTNTTPSLVGNLTINNASGTVTLSKPVTIQNLPGTQRLYLQNGALITTAINILTLNNDVQATGVAALNANVYNLNSFVDGPMRKIGDNDFIFPVGKVGSGLHKIGIDYNNPPNATTAFVAQYFRANPQTLSTKLAAGLEKLSACEYWTLDRTGSSPARVVLSWENNSGCGGQYVTDPNLLTLRVARFNPANNNTWENEGYLPGSKSGGVTAGTITSNILVNNFSPFALASSSTTANPLPVVFGDVKAYEKNGDVQIEWSNLTEMDVAEYTIERSSNGQDFTAIATQWPTSNQNDKVTYTSLDDVPATGANYYRIKVMETSGKIVYSKILSVNLGRANFGLQLYPNPVIGNEVTITLSNMKRGQYNLRVLNATGQDIFRKMIINQSSYQSQTLNLPSTIKPGVYHMLITADDYRETKIFIVR